MSSTAHYIVKSDDLVALRVAMSILLDECNQAILDGKWKFPEAIEAK